MVLVCFVLLLRPCQASNDLERSGQLEVFIADNFEDGSHSYRVFLHDDASEERIRLNPASFGTSLSSLRSEMKAKIWLQPTEPTLSKRDLSSDQTVEDFVFDTEEQVMDVEKFELVRSDQVKFEFAAFHISRANSDLFFPLHCCS